MLKLTEELSIESDRAVAVLTSAYLDFLLGELIVSQMQAASSQIEEMLFQNGNGPLGSFSSRIDTLYCMGLLKEDEHKDLHLIRKIRNDFAHQFTGVTFTSNTISNRCRELKAAKIGGQPPTARERFIKTAVRLMVDIILRLSSD